MAVRTEAQYSIFPAHKTGSKREDCPELDHKLLTGKANFRHFYLQENLQASLISTEFKLERKSELEHKPRQEHGCCSLVQQLFAI